VLSSWRPQISVDGETTKELTKFGAWVGLTGILSWSYAWADSLVVSRFLGGHDLGLFRTGSHFASLAFLFVFGPVVPVICSYLSKVSGDADNMRVKAELVLRILTVIAIPIAITLWAYSTLLEKVLFGEKWSGLGVVIGAMALMHGYSWIVGMNGEFYRAKGKPNIETFVMAGTLVIYLGAYLYVVTYGLEVFVWVRLTLALGALVLHIALLRAVVKIAVFPAIRQILLISVLCSAVIWGTKTLAIGVLEAPLSQPLLGGLVSTTIVVFLLYFIERKATLPIFLQIIRK
jgi:O-antigen/teichoic acid export membrane protein